MKKINFKSLSQKTSAKAAAITAAVIFLIFIFFLSAVHSGGIAKGVRVNGIDIGGMSISDAENVLRENAPNVNQGFTVRSASGAEKEISAADFSFSYNAQVTAKTAYAMTHTKNIFRNFFTELKLFFAHADIPYECDADADALDEILYGFGAEENGELINYRIEFSEQYVNVSRGIPGQSRDVSAARAELLSALARGEFTARVTFEKAEPPEPDIETLYNEIYIAPQDARYEISDWKVMIYPEQNGRQIDKIEAGTQLERLKNGETITLKIITLTPDITLEALNERLFNHTLGEYSTQYSVSAKNRSRNVELAASKINGVILAPGEDFSFNSTVGERTKANGFLDAPVFENGETVQGAGGGVCQVSSTLYSAVLYADLEIVTRRNHSLTVAYVPKGQDATVAYGTIDFQFKNNTEYPIKISTSAKNGKLTISIYGTKPDLEKRVKITNNILTTQQPETEEVIDRSLLTGSKKVLSAGKTGYTVETIRTVYENGVLTKTEKMGTSVYKPVPTRVAVGAAVPTPMPTLEPRATPLPEEPTESEVD